MGDSGQGHIDESPRHNARALLKAVILLVFGIFAPVMATVMTWSIFPEINIQSMVWIWNQHPYLPSFYGFYLMDPNILKSVWPFLLFRMVTVAMVYRYYTEKTTRTRALIASCVGDGVFIIISIPMALISIIFAGGYYIIPIPIQMISALLILWRSPLPEPMVPWESEEEPEFWWAKSSQTE